MPVVHQDARENNSLMTDDEDEDEVEDLDALAKGMDSRPTSGAAKPSSAAAASTPFTTPSLQSLTANLHDSLQ